MIITYKVTTTPLIEERIILPALCKACGANEGKLIISHIKIRSILWMSSTVCRADVVCAKCGKKYPKSNYGDEIRQIIKERKIEYKPSFLKRHGIIVFGIIVLFALIIGFFVSASISKKERMTANENYATTHTQTDRVQWLQNLQPGDVVLARRGNAPYDAPATVFILKSVEESTITFDAYKNDTIPYEEYRDLSKMKAHSFGTGTSEAWIANKSTFYKTEQLVSAETDDYLNLYLVLQVVKK